MKVLLSIKPQHAENIFNGSKLYEFRKVLFKRKDITSVVVYASSPVKRVIGEFIIDEILESDVESIWNITSNNSGISEEYYYEYFKNKTKAYAIKIKSVNRFKEPRRLYEDYSLKFAPQSFIYLKNARNTAPPSILQGD